MENPRHIIINCLKTFQIRAFRQAIFEKVSQVLFLAMFLLAVLFIGSRLVLFPFSMTLVTLLAVIGAVGLGICFSFRYRKTLADMAGFVDERLQLKERASTSLELIQENRQDELAQLQIRDCAKGVENVDRSEIMPHTPPRMLKWIPIPLLIIGLSFAVPRQYELPQPPTVAEREAIDTTIENLSNELKNVHNPILQEKIEKTIKGLKNIKDVDTVHAHLRALNSEVLKEKSELPNETTIAEVTQATQHFNNMDATTLADELERLAGQVELTPELRNELAELFAKLAENVPQGGLSRALDQIQGKAVSPDTLQEIADALREVSQLNQLEAQLTESRKDIALASIETDQSTGGVTSSDSAPGTESGNQETQGSLVSGNTSDFSPSSDDTTSSTEDNVTEKPLTGDATPSLQIAGNEVEINSEIASDSQTITRVFTGKAGDGETEPDYLPFSDAVLAAQREYAKAIENNRIPVRYRSQIKAYLEAIAKINEK